MSQQDSLYGDINNRHGKAPFSYGLSAPGNPNPVSNPLGPELQSVYISQTTKNSGGSLKKKSKPSHGSYTDIQFSSYGGIGLSTDSKQSFVPSSLPVHPSPSRSHSPPPPPPSVSLPIPPAFVNTIPSFHSNPQLPSSPSVPPPSSTLLPLVSESLPLSQQEWTKLDRDTLQQLDQVVSQTKDYLLVEKTIIAINSNDDKDKDPKQQTIPGLMFVTGRNRNSQNVEQKSDTNITTPPTTIHTPHITLALQYLIGRLSHVSTTPLQTWVFRDRSTSREVVADEASSQHDTEEMVDLTTVKLDQVLLQVLTIPTLQHAVFSGRPNLFDHSQEQHQPWSTVLKTLVLENVLFETFEAIQTLEKVGRDCLNLTQLVLVDSLSLLPLSSSQSSVLSLSSLFVRESLLSTLAFNFPRLGSLQILQNTENFDASPPNPSTPATLETIPKLWRNHAGTLKLLNLSGSNSLMTNDNIVTLFQVFAESNQQSPQTWSLQKLNLSRRHLAGSDMVVGLSNVLNETVGVFLTDLVLDGHLFSFSERTQILKAITQADQKTLVRFSMIRNELISVDKNDNNSSTTQEYKEYNKAVVTMFESSSPQFRHIGLSGLNLSQVLRPLVKRDQHLDPRDRKRTKLASLHLHDCRIDDRSLPLVVKVLNTPLVILRVTGSDQQEAAGGGGGGGGGGRTYKETIMSKVEQTPKILKALKKKIDRQHTKVAALQLDGVLDYAFRYRNNSNINNNNNNNNNSSNNTHKDNESSRSPETLLASEARVQECMDLRDALLDTVSKAGIRFIYEGEPMDLRNTKYTVVSAAGGGNGARSGQGSYSGGSGYSYNGGGGSSGGNYGYYEDPNQPDSPSSGDGGDNYEDDDDDEHPTGYDSGECTDPDDLTDDTDDDDRMDVEQVAVGEPQPSQQQQPQQRSLASISSSSSSSAAGTSTGSKRQRSSVLFDTTTIRTTISRPKGPHRSKPLRYDFKKDGAKDLARIMEMGIPEGWYDFSGKGSRSGSVIARDNPIQKNESTIEWQQRLDIISLREQAERERVRAERAEARLIELEFQQQRFQLMQIQQQQLEREQQQFQPMQMQQQELERRQQVEREQQQQLEQQQLEQQQQQQQQLLERAQIQTHHHHQQQQQHQQYGQQYQQYGQQYEQHQPHQHDQTPPQNSHGGTYTGFDPQGSHSFPNSPTSTTSVSSPSSLTQSQNQEEGTSSLSNSSSFASSSNASPSSQELQTYTPVVEPSSPKVRQDMPMDVDQTL